jgi:hypothetical protein
MVTRNVRSSAIALTFCASLLAPAAHAQLSGLLNRGSTGAAGALGSLGSLGGSASALSPQSLTSGSTGNVAGVLDYCIRNHYLGGSASTVQDALTRKLPGGASTSDSAYAQGAKGILADSQGQQIDLGGSGLKQQITKQICEKILTQGQSLL